MHCAVQLLGEFAQIHIDVFEQRSVPYGLVRHGTAPDHVEGEMLAQRFEEITGDPRLRLLAGVKVGSDITRAELTAHYDAVVWAVGASEPRHLGIPGEQLPGVCTADDFFGWYTGLAGAPQFSLAGVREVVVVGFGDVGQDVARILLKPAQSFTATHMPPQVLAELAAHRVRRVSVLNRSGAARLKLKPRVLRELVSLPNVAVELEPPQLGPLPDDVDRKTRDSVLALEEAARHPTADPSGHLHIALSRRPVAILGNERAEAVRVESTDARGDGSGVREYAAQLVVTAVGDDVAHVPDLPWDPATRTIPSRETRLIDDNGVVQVGEYVTGWAARGNVAGFGSTRRDAAQVSAALDGDHRGGLLGAPQPGPEHVDALLARRGVSPIGWEGWHRLTALEAVRGTEIGRPSARIVDPEEQDAVVRGS